MQNNATLNCLYTDYSTGRLEKKNFEGMIFKTIYKKIPRLAGFKKEEHEDFISWLYPRISRAIDNYHAVGSSFEAYITNLVHMAAREYRLRQNRGYNAEIAAMISQIPEMYACEKEFEYSGYLEAPAVQTQMQEYEQKNVKKSRGLLMLILKCCRYVSGDFLDKISQELEMEPETLSAMINRLTEGRKKREAGADLLRKRANYWFCRCLFYEKTLQSTKENPLVVQKMKKRLGHSRDRLARIREQLAKVSLDPSNAQIAELLGVTKGTVDAALFSYKKRLAKNLNNKNRHMLN